MKNLLKVLLGSFKLILRDTLLFSLVFTPWFQGSLLYFGLPLLQPLLLQTFAFDLTPWYVLSDMTVLMLAPMMAGVLCGFLMLDERDEGVGEYYNVTPLGGAGYLASRILLPMLYSIGIAPILMALFSLSHPDILRVLFVVLCGGLFGASLALLLLSFASNKVEGLAVSKIMGILMLPMVIPFLTDSPWGYLAAAFPTFWMGVLFKGQITMLPLALLVSCVWIILLYRRTCQVQV
jgi:fluoroquinolone transport system permease protein